MDLTPEAYSTPTVKEFADDTNVIGTNLTNTTNHDAQNWSFYTQSTFGHTINSNYAKTPQYFNYQSHTTNNNNPELYSNYSELSTDSSSHLLQFNESIPTTDTNMINSLSSNEMCLPTTTPNVDYGGYSFEGHYDKPQISGWCHNECNKSQFEHNYGNRVQYEKYATNVCSMDKNAKLLNSSFFNKGHDYNNYQLVQENKNDSLNKLKNCSNNEYFDSTAKLNDFLQTLSSPQIQPIDSNNCDNFQERVNSRGLQNSDYPYLNYNSNEILHSSESSVWTDRNESNDKDNYNWTANPNVDFSNTCSNYNLSNSLLQSNCLFYSQLCENNYNYLHNFYKNQSHAGSSLDWIHLDQFQNRNNLNISNKLQTLNEHSNYCVANFSNTNQTYVEKQKIPKKPPINNQTKMLQLQKKMSTSNLVSEKFKKLLNIDCKQFELFLPPIEFQILIDLLNANQHNLFHAVQVDHLQTNVFKMSNNVCSDQIKLHLKDAKIWSAIYSYNTEMIATNTGRRIFPTLSVDVSGLCPTDNYAFILDMLLIKPNVFKHRNGKWTANNECESITQLNEPCELNTYSIQEDSPKSGAYWMEAGVNFSRTKITNYKEIKKNKNMIHVNSMHHYIPRFTIFRINLIDANQSIFENQQNSVEFVASYIIPGTQFYTVTAYQNPDVIRIKIDHNPFAKAFRNRQDTDSFFENKLIESMPVNFKRPVHLHHFT